MRLIDADALMADFQKAFPTFDVKSSHAKALLATAPTIRQTAGMCFGCNCPKMEKLEAEPIQHGRWIVDQKFGNDVMSGGRMVICSACGKGAFDKHNYCPNCGARMDEVGE